MEESVRIQNILSRIRKLDYEARLYLVERLNEQLRNRRRAAKPTSHHLTELNTLGSEIWENVNIDKYIEQERQWD